MTLPYENYTLTMLILLQIGLQSQCNPNQETFCLLLFILSYKYSCIVK